MRRWLKRQGCRFVEGTNHTIVLLGGKRTQLPRHGRQELKPKTLESILRDLGLKLKR
jgi:mRNA interferase HicA